MIRKFPFILILFLVPFLQQCKKPPRQWKISYGVTPIGNSKGEYKVFFQSSSSEIQQGNFPNNIWKSDDYVIEEGQPVFLRFQRVSGSGRFQLFIYRDGAEHEKGEVNSSAKTVEISDFV